MGMHRFRKAGISVTAVALAASGIVVLFAMPASAKSTAPKGKVTCTQMTGSTGSGFITLSGCTGNAVPGTGGSSQPISIALLVNGGPVTWTNNNVTTFGAPALSSKKATHCPGYVKPTKTNPTPANEPSLDQFSGSVTADNTGMKVPGKYKGFICIDPSGNFSAPKPLKIS
jgi:hypothetical protein